MKDSLKRTIRISGQLVFWMVSINLWSIVFNPMLGYKFGIFGFGSIVLLISTLFFIYTAIPLVWFLRKPSKKIKIILSFFFGLTFFTLVFPQAFSPKFNNNLGDISEVYFKYYLYVVAFHSTLIFAVYFNSKKLVPKFLNNRLYWKYSLLLVLLTFSSSIANLFLFDYILDPLFPTLFYISYLTFGETVLVTAVYLIITSLVYLIWQYGAFLEIKKEKTQNELMALKAQINPHFLFNNLNTIYSLASTGNERVKDVILKLSDFLRYVIYDTSVNFIPLEKETEIIRTYISLQEERVDNQKVTINFSTKGDFGNAMISPLLLLPLVENCFKHGIGKDGGSISIMLNFEGKTLYFNTLNTIATPIANANNQAQGLGLINLEKQLTLLYPERYRLEYSKKDDKFAVDLSVKLI